MKDIPIPRIALPPRLRQAQLSVLLVIARKPGVLVAADLVLLFVALIAVLVGGGLPGELYQGLVVIPTLLLALPVLADSVAVERRAGSMDLALSSPTPWYFERRVASFGALILTQDLLLVLIIWLSSSRPFPLLVMLLDATLLVAFLATLALFWAVRLRATGSVLFACALTVTLTSHWIFSDPTQGEDPPGRLVPSWGDSLAQASHFAALAVAALLLWLYARRRLTHPELML